MLLQRLNALAIACSPLDAGQTDVMYDRYDRPLADFRDTECPPWSKNQKKKLISYTNIVQHKSNCIILYKLKTLQDELL